jgi:membrane-anchored glycerophosphoryl diester phosphodiesterase (GDPDase)
MLEIFFVNQAEYLVMWIASCLSFGAICSATQQIKEGTIQSFQDSFAAVRRRTGPLLRLSLLLYFIACLMMAAASLVSTGFIWIARQRHAHLSHFTIQLVVVTTVALVFLVFSRFMLAMPALILDDCRVGQAVLRSDELTEGKWLTLAVLLAKSLVGGYVVAMCPYWLASWILAGTSLPSWFPWFLDAASVAAVIVVEPTMFIGFALLYLEMSALPAAPGDALVVK